MGRANRVKSIEHAASIVRFLATANGRGLGLATVAAATGLHKATAHRALGALIAEGWADQDPETRRYYLGHELVALGSAAANRHNLQDLARPSLARLADKIGDTLFLSVRSGFDSLCVDRHEGAFPIRALSMNVGSRRPLGLGAGSLAQLAFLPDPEVDEIIAYNAPRWAAGRDYGEADCRAAVARARSLGYAYFEGLMVEGVSGMGVPVFDLRQRPTAALSVAAISERMPADRCAEIAEVLMSEARMLERKLWGRIGSQPNVGRTDADGPTPPPARVQ